MPSDSFDNGAAGMSIVLPPTARSHLGMMLSPWVCMSTVSAVSLSRCDWSVARLIGDNSRFRVSASSMKGLWSRSDHVVP
ncbi:Uncharacterised protein [Mycobacteroides abscessus subsp. abscessus]|nr:Uncharacterised protein [Mycobacteroides abscessus subsp. abscessus]